MNRRKFIRTTSLAATVYPFLSVLSSCKTNQEKGNNIFVFIQLSGGNDGLNTLIPLDKYKEIIKARPKLFIPEKRVLPIKGNDINGLHPSLGGIKDLYDNNLIGFVQSVGYENQNYSHFRSQDIWLSASGSSDVINTGWMARFLETNFNHYPEGFPNLEQPDPPAIKVGDMGSFLFQGNAMDMSIVIDPISKNFDVQNSNLNASNPIGLAALELKNIRKILLQTEKYSTAVKNALSVSFTHSNLYPETGKNPLADQLKQVAKLINGGLQTSVYHVDLKGFDTHSAQVNPTDTTKGSHAELLAQLSQALVCFWDDVCKMGKENEISGMTFSEFGRRIVSNTAYGTDHGAAQPLLFFGANIQPGIIGVNPEIPQNANNTDNLSMQFDFRRIYASILKNRMETTDEKIQDILMGDFSPVGIFKDI